MRRWVFGAVLVGLLLGSAGWVAAQTQPKSQTQQQQRGTSNPADNLTFTPNVDIPGLFEGPQPVDSTLFGRYLGAFFVYFIGIIGVLSVVVMMWGGYHYIVSAGNPQKMREGKETITNALIGLTLALTSFLLLRLINPNLVSFQGLVPSFVRESLQPLESIARPEKTGSRVSVSAGSLAQIAARVRSAGYQTIVKTEADRRNLGPDFKYRLLALLFIESAGNPNAVSQVGACGLIQLLPTTAGVSCQQLLDPTTNIKKAAEYYGGLVKSPCIAPSKSAPCTNGQICNANDPIFANAAYNGGRGSNRCSKSCPGQTWWQCAENEGYAETRAYVQKAQITYDWLKANFTF